MYQKILLAYDGSESGQQALLNSKEITQWEHGELHLLAVMPHDLVALGPEVAYYDPETAQAQKEKFQSILSQGIARLASLGVSANGQLAQGDPVDEIVRYAETIHADLIVVGHKHRNSWVARWWQSSISKALIELSPCSLLIVITH